jgi:hypothetical protein
MDEHVLADRPVRIRYVMGTCGNASRDDAASSLYWKHQLIRTPSDKESTEPMGAPDPPQPVDARKSIMPTLALSLPHFQTAIAAHRPNKSSQAAITVRYCFSN